MIMASAGQVTIDNVQFDRMGQTSRLGRYPIHWHLGGDRSGDILRGASITNSNNRGVTIHGNAQCSRPGCGFLHDVHGHGFFMEDGVEKPAMSSLRISLSAFTKLGGKETGKLCSRSQ